MNEQDLTSTDTKSTHTQSTEAQSIEIREMTKADLSLAMEWAKEEGWNPGKYDYQGYYAQDPGGFFMLWLDGKPIGSISVVRYGETFGFIGLFIVQKEHRGKGYGAQLWDYGMQHLSQCTQVGLYAVAAQVGRYKKGGFFENGKKNQRFDKQKGSMIDKDFLVDNKSLSIVTTKEQKQGLFNYDQTQFGFSRKKLIKTTLQQSGSHAYITFDQTSGKVNGYGLIRSLDKGYRITLYSDSPDSAKALMEILLSHMKEDEVAILDMSGGNTFSKAFAAYFQLAPHTDVDTTVMYKGTVNDGTNKDENCYGRFSLEIG